MRKAKVKVRIDEKYFLTRTSNIIVGMRRRVEPQLLSIAC